MFTNFDYVDGAKGYVKGEHKRGDHLLGKMVDGYGKPKYPGATPLPDGKPDVNCRGVVETPAFAIDCNPYGKVVPMAAFEKDGYVFRFGSCP